MNATIILTDGTAFTLDADNGDWPLTTLVRELAHPQSRVEFGMDDHRGCYRSFTPQDVASLTITR